MAVLGSLALGACSSDNDSIDIAGNEADQLITLTVANNNTIRTRAGRPLVSAEANQSIENVLVYVVNTNDNSIAATKKFSSWQSESQEYGTNDGKYANFLLENKLEDGTYKIFAVGYHNSSSYGDIESALKSGSTFKENAVLQLTSDNGAEEIFAGATEPFEVKKAQGFKQEVVLNRQVAGVYVYVKDIPYIAEATMLRLVSSAENDQLVLGQFSNLKLDNNGTGNSIEEAVVNGYSTRSFDKTLVSIDLNDWFTTIEDKDGNNMIDAGDAYSNWKKPEFPGATTTPTFQKGSVFGGSFIVPFAKTGSEQTLKLQLTTSGGDVKREWNVNLPSTETNTYNLYTWNGSQFNMEPSVTEDKNSYNIVRNHLYGLGSRTSDDLGHGTDPEPTPGEDDDPISLNNKHEIDLVVNDN